MFPFSSTALFAFSPTGTRSHPPNYHHPPSAHPPPSHPICTSAHAAAAHEQTPLAPFTAVATPAFNGFQPKRLGKRNSIPLEKDITRCRCQPVKPSPPQPTPVSLPCRQTNPPTSPVDCCFCCLRQQSLVQLLLEPLPQSLSLSLRNSWWSSAPAVAKGAGSPPLGPLRAERTTTEEPSSPQPSPASTRTVGASSLT